MKNGKSKNTIKIDWGNMFEWKMTFMYITWNKRFSQTYSRKHDINFIILSERETFIDELGWIFILQNIVGRDNGNEDYLFSSLNRNDVELDNSGLSNSTNNQVSMYYSCSCFVKIIVYQPFSYENYICTNAGILYCSGVFLSGHLSLLMWAPGEGSNNNNHDWSSLSPFEKYNKYSAS